MDVDYFDRVSIYYPPLSSKKFRTNFDDCPQFWKENKVKIQPHDLSKIGRLGFIQVYSAIIGSSGALTVTIMLLFRFGHNFLSFKEEKCYKQVPSTVSTIWSKIRSCFRQPARKKSTLNTKNTSIYTSKGAVWSILKLFVLFFFSHASDILDSLLGNYFNFSHITFV